MTTNNKKTIDFFRPVRSTNSFSSQKTTKSATPAASNKPKISPVYRSVPTSRPAKNVSRTVPKKQQTPQKATKKPYIELSPKAIAKSQIPQKQQKPENKPTYPFGGESPFLKDAKVEKRPLSDSIPKKNPFDDPNFGRDQKFSLRPDPVRVAPKSKKIDDRLSLLIIIIITIILGIATGVGVFFLIAR